MRWEEYYEKLGDWATSTAVGKMSTLESFGPSDEIIDAINQIGFDDEKGATRLLKKALAAGVKFTGDQLSELFLICDEEAINRAIRLSSDQFGTDDLAALYGFSDGDFLIDIAKAQKIPLPEVLVSQEEDFEYDSEEDETYDATPLSRKKLIAEYDYILNCLYQAHERLAQARKLSFADTSHKNRSATVLKYAILSEAETYIEDAIIAWGQLEVPGKDTHLLRDIRLNISNSTMWQNYLFEGFFTNLMVQKRIRKVTKNIEVAYNVVQNLRNTK